MTCVEKESYKEDDTKNDGENSSDGIWNIVYGVFNTSDLSKSGSCDKQQSD